MTSIARSLPVGSAQEALYADMVRGIQAAQGISALLEATLAAICSLLKRKDDAEHLTKTLAATSKYFLTIMGSAATPAGEKLDNLRKFAKEIVWIVIVERAFIARPSVEASAPETPRRRVVDTRPDALASHEPVRLVALEGLAEVDAGPGPDEGGDGLADGHIPTVVVTVDPPPPCGFDGFTALFPAAVRYRVEHVAAFFQRYNPGLERGLVRPFLLSGPFAERLGAVVTAIIVPQMIATNRNLAMLESSHQWAGVDAAGFWEIVDRNERARTGILGSWIAAWDGCRQRKAVRQVGGIRKEVLTASPLLLQIRERLAPQGGEYVVPAIRNGEIDLFAAMLYDFDLDRLEYTWTRLRQLYEQELDRRAYQDKARVGAFRDSILDAFEMVPDRCGDFLALLCYFCFPNIDLAFLDRFTHNKGSTAEERRHRVPYLMQFLAGHGVAEARRREGVQRRNREEAGGVPRR